MSKQTTENELRTLEAQRFKAMLEADVAKMSEFMHEGMGYSHSRGDRDNKDDYIRKVKDGIYRYNNISHKINNIVSTDVAAVIWGHMVATSVVEGDVKKLNIAYMVVWIKQDGRWQFVGYQPTPMLA